MMYPTPRSSGQENPETLIKRKGLRAAAQHNLIAAVKLLPTPNAWDGKRGPRSQKNLIEKQHQINLITAIKDSQSKNPVHQWMYKTPMARDHKDINFNNTWKLGIKAQSTMAREVLKDNKPGGKLNPNFVEFN